jgi:heme/copper-type cytochrome/quinol oxidase subunit 2
MPSDKLLRDVGDVSAKGGRIHALFSAIMTSIVMVIMLVIGVLILVSQLKYKKSVKANITKVEECSSVESSKDGNTNKNCKVSLSYKIGDKEYTKDNFITSSIVGKDQTITIWYDPKEPHDIIDSKMLLIVSIFLIAFSIILVVISWVWYYLATQSKFIAQADAAGLMAGQIGKAFR